MKTKILAITVLMLLVGAASAFCRSKRTELNKIVYHKCVVEGIGETFIL